MHIRNVWKILAVAGLAVLFTGALPPPADAQCRPGQVSGSCRDGSWRCCRPRGTVDCGNGRHCFSGERCARGRCVPSAQAPRRPSQRIVCRPGTYFCPGEINGCCPNGWGCASRSCIPPR